jgi:hypothetical protein
MRQANLDSSLAEKPQLPLSKIASEKEGVFGKLNEWLSEWCSPILVKETRQALKSKQFLYTYCLLLITVAIWVVIGIGWNQWSGSEQMPSGRDLLYGMLVIIAVPLGIVIPFSAFRSLANEFDEGTIQLVSITTMKPYQIVLGKLGSALLQMLVYLSVMAPCMLLAYMLRGVSLPQILWAIGFSMWGSFCLTVLGLFLGGLIKGRGFNTFVSVAFVLALAFLNYSWYWIIDEFIRMTPPSESHFDKAMFLLFAHSGAFALLFLVAATTQISFRADNHATPIRIAMMIHQALFLGTLVALVSLQGSLPRKVSCGFMMIAAHYWLAMGFLMVGEQSELSRRIQRTLPTTFSGRTFSSLLYPGAGRGYLFAVAMIWGVNLTIALVGFLQEEIVMIQGGPLISTFMSMVPATIGTEAFYQALIISIYPCLYLSLIYLFAQWRFQKLRTRAIGYGPFASLVAGFFLVLISMVIAALAQSNFGNNRMEDGSEIASFFNWYWVVGNLMQSQWVSDLWFYLFQVPSLVIILFSVSRAAKELLQTPIAVPQRVLEDVISAETKLPAGETIDEIFSDIASKETR